MNTWGSKSKSSASPNTPEDTCSEWKTKLFLARGQKEQSCSPQTRIRLIEPNHCWGSSFSNRECLKEHPKAYWSMLSKILFTCGWPLNRHETGQMKELGDFRDTPGIYAMRSSWCTGVWVTGGWCEGYFFKNRFNNWQNKWKYGMNKWDLGEIAFWPLHSTRLDGLDLMEKSKLA